MLGGPIVGAITANDASDKHGSVNCRSDQTHASPHFACIRSRRKPVRLRLGRCGLDGLARGPQRARRADRGLRGASRLVDAGTQRRRLADLPGHRPPAGRPHRGSGLHARGAAAGRGVPARRIVGLRHARLLRTDESPRGFPRRIRWWSQPRHERAARYIRRGHCGPAGLWTPARRRVESEGRRSGRPQPLEISRTIAAARACGSGREIPTAPQRIVVMGIDHRKRSLHEQGSLRRSART